MKLRLKGRRFITIEEIQAQSQRMLNTLQPANFQQWENRWNRCVQQTQGDYFEDDSGI